jgi:hypothetical protein
MVLGIENLKGKISRMGEVKGFQILMGRIFYIAMLYYLKIYSPPFYLKKKIMYRGIAIVYLQRILKKNDFRPSNFGCNFPFAPISWEQGSFEAILPRPIGIIQATYLHSPQFLLIGIS